VPKNTLESAPKGDPNLVSTTTKSAEGSGAVIRHRNDTFQRGLRATPRQSMANSFAGQHFKLMPNFSALYSAQPDFFKHGRQSQARLVLQLAHRLALDVGEGQKQTRCIDSPVRRRGGVE
jgi:hypothetical protein